MVVRFNHGGTKDTEKKVKVKSQKEKGGTRKQKPSGARGEHFLPFSFLLLPF
jgi:hypothetical protein